jgi:predicted nucleic acid-binding protein
LKRLLLDVNVVLDVLLERSPHQETAAALWAALETGRGRGVLAAHAVTTIHNLVERSRGRRIARQAVEALLPVYEVAPIDGAVLRNALALDWPDLEDAVGAAAAAPDSCDALVTRDQKGFRQCGIPVIDPGTALAWLTVEPEETPSTTGD